MKPFLRHASILLALTVSAMAGDAGTTCFAPFVRGRYWFYDATVKFATDNGVKEQQITHWKSEVIDTFEGKDFKAALLYGSPFDLAWYQENKLRHYLIVHLGKDGIFSITRCDDENLVKQFAQIKATSVFPQELADGEISFNPATCEKDVKDYGPEFRYQWIIENVWKAPLEPSIKGVLADAKFEHIAMSYRGTPEHSFFDFTVGVGITGYTYVHHGTAGDCEVNLVETGITLPPDSTPADH